MVWNEIDTGHFAQIVHSSVCDAFIFRMRKAYLRQLSRLLSLSIRHAQGVERQPKLKHSIPMLMLA